MAASGVFRSILLLLLLACTATPTATAWWPLAKAPTTDAKGRPATPSADTFLQSARQEHGRLMWLQLETKSRTNACWRTAAEELQHSCRKVRSDDKLRSRLALRLAACDSESDGRSASSFHCLSASNVQACVKSLSDAGYGIFVQYRLHTDILCAYLQEELFQERTELAIHALQEGTHNATATMTELRRAGQETYEEAVRLAALQRSSLDAVHEVQTEVRRTRDQHAQSLHALQNSTTAVLQQTSSASAALSDLRAHIVESATAAADAITSLGTEALERFHALEGHTKGLTHLIQRLEEAQQLIARRTITLQDILTALLAALLVALFTSTRRTSRARTPALLLLLAGVALPLLLRSQSGRRGSGGGVLLLCGVPWLHFSIAGAAATIALAAYTYISPLSLQRQMVREEMQQMLTEMRRLLTDPPTMAPPPTQPSTPMDDSQLVPLQLSTSFGRRDTVQSLAESVDSVLSTPSTVPAARTRARSSPKPKRTASKRRTK